MNFKPLRPLRHTFLLFSVCLLAACSGSGRKSIVILYENDVHCNIDGYARLRGFADSIADTAFVGIVSSGDYLHGGTAGAISGGRYVAGIMREVCYDAVGLGNHEFDFGVPHLVQLMSGTNLPVVNCNLRTNDGSPLFPAYVIRTYGDRSVAFIGVVTPESLVSEAYSFYDRQNNQLYGLCRDSLVAVVQRNIDEARRSGADYVVLLSHLGEVSARSCLTSHELVHATRGVDVVLDAHTHSTVPCDTVSDADGRPVMVTQTGTQFRNIGKLVIDPCGNISVGLLPMDSVRSANARVREVTDSIRAEMAGITSVPVCRSDYVMEILDSAGRQKVRYAETNAGDLVCDAFRALTDAALAVNNGGGIRSQLPAGNWTYGDVISMLPYNNYLQVIRIKGSELVELLTATTSNVPKEDGQFPQVSGFRFVLDTCAIGSARISCVEILDDTTGRYSPIDLTADYTLCTTDYCVSGGGMYNVLRGAEVLRDNIMLYNEALVRYVTDYLGGVVPERYSAVQGRIVLKSAKRQ